MMAMPIRLSEIKNHFSSSNLLSAHIGSDPLIQGIAAVENCQIGELTFVSTKAYLQEAITKQPAALVVSENLVEAASQFENVALLVAKNVKLAHALIKQTFANRDFIDNQWDKIHPSAVIHKTVNLPKNCFIGPNVVIGQNSILGEHCRLLAGVVLENDVVIGDNCLLHPNCVIGYNCQLGNNVEICAGTIIGTEGFGFAQNEKGQSFKIPQTGYVVIEDNVLLGACNTVDRATYGVTTIGAGTKTDNIVHIAHNVTIGKDCLFTPMLAVAGSTTFGDRCITSGQTQVSDHINICDDVILYHRASVTRDITESGSYGGSPVQPFKQYIKNAAQLKKLAKLNKKVNKMEKILEQLTQTK